VQGDKTGDASLLDILKAYIRKKYDKPGEAFLGSPHRIDRPTSGIVIFCRNSRSLERMNEIFREKKIQKIYWAVVKNQPPKDEDKLIHFLKKNEVKNKSFSYEKEIAGSVRAELDYKVIAKSDKYFLLKVQLHTGRHHQIRAQLSHIGCPVKGDVKYGFDRPNEDASIHLHSRKAEFLHPSKKELLTIVAPVPDEKLWKFFESNVSQ
jgi:23S rRNA pseudouridine1911/1915/1917 synthase